VKHSLEEVQAATSCCHMMWQLAQLLPTPSVCFGHTDLHKLQQLLVVELAWYHVHGFQLEAVLPSSARCNGTHIQGKNQPVFMLISLLS
jgi:hypothetical protein